MDTTTLILLYLLVAFIGWVIFYYTVKAAVKNGFIEANEYKGIPRDTKPETQPNAKQLDLKKQYDLGIITFDEYQKKWVEAT